MAKGARQRGKSQGAEITIQIKEPAGRTLGTPSRKGTRSVIKVSQLLLRAIADQPRLTLAELKKELGNAGYEVCQNIKGDNRDSTRSERGTLLWVSGSDTTGYFRVWKVPKSRKKVGQSWLVLGRRSSRKTLLQSRSRSTSPRLRRPRSRRKAAKKAREFWNHKSRIFKAKSRITRSMVRKRIRSRARSGARSRGRSRARSRAKAQVCARAQEQACARSKEQARARARTQKCVQGREQECTNTREEAHMGARMQTRARAMDNIRAGPSTEDGRSRSKNERRPNSKSRDEKRQEPERVVKRTIQKPAVAIVKSVSSIQRKAPTKASAKSDSPGCSRNP